MIKINGKEVPYRQGQTVLEAAREAEIYIPTLCTHPELPAFGACRLCIVKVEGMKGFPTACTTPLKDGMVISTDDGELQGLRRGVLEMLLSEHPSTCIICRDSDECEECRLGPTKAGTVTGCTFCPKKQDCELREVADYLGLSDLRLPFHYKNLPTERDDIFFDRDYNLCILCGRCVRVCQEIRGAATIAFTHRSQRTKIGTAFNKPHLESNCGFCGACVDVCPTGALSARGSKWYGDADGCTSSVCVLCNVGCGFNYETKWGRVMAAIPSNGPTRAQACVRGRFCIPALVNQTDRLKQPMIRVDGKLVPASWEDAIAYATDKLREYKPDEIGLIASPFLTSESAFILQKFARTVLGTNNIDSTISDFITPVIKTLVESGSMGAKNRVAHLEESDWIILLGNRLFKPSNALIPSIRRARKQGARVIQIAYKPMAPSYVVDEGIELGPAETLKLFYGIIRKLISSNPKPADCENIGAFSKSVEKIDASKLDGVAVDEIANLIGSGKGSIIFDQDALRCLRPEQLVKAIMNTLILSQNTDGFISYIEAGNAQGICDVGAMPQYLPGYVQASKEGQSLGEMLDGGVRALYLTEALPAEELEKIEFLILQDTCSSELLNKADVVFAASAFTEQDGTVTSLEHKVQNIGKAVCAPGSAQPDWKIITDLANRMGAKGFGYKTSGDVSKEIKTTQPSDKRDSRPKLLPFSAGEVKDLPQVEPRYLFRGADICARVEDFRIQMQGGETK